MKLIPLTQGKFAMVDNADYEAVSAHKWHATKRGRVFYAARTLQNGDNQFLHQFLLPGVPRIDHRDGNGLNNRRKNIRPATHKQNAQGFQRKRLGVTSKYRGVCWNKRRGKWQAQIRIEGKVTYLGLFKNEKDAALAFDAAARKYRGEFAHLNFP